MVGIGQFLFVRIWGETDLISVAEVQLLWEDKVGAFVFLGGAAGLGWRVEGFDISNDFEVVFWILSIRYT